MSKSSEGLLSDAEIEFFKANQDKITTELLDALRAQGNKGKKQAIQILETPKNEKNYYLDAFGQPISFDGHKGLKKSGTLMPLFPIHLSEIERCADDFSYFRENYIQIMTRKGINFPDIRDYQLRLIDAILDNDNEEIVGLIGRQCVSGDSVLELEDRNTTIKELFDNPEKFKEINI